MTTTFDSIVRTHAGRPVPVPGRYEVDPVRTSVEFIARHPSGTGLRGRFTGVSGTITVDEEPERSSTEIEIDVARVATGNSSRDAHLRGPDLLDVDRFPRITFRSTRVTAGTAGAWTVTGDLTIRGITRSIHLDASFDGAARSTDGATRITFTARTQVNSDDWGVVAEDRQGSHRGPVVPRVQVDLDVRARCERPAATLRAE